jgi:hypothetical protein
LEDILILSFGIFNPNIAVRMNASINNAPLKGFPEIQANPLTDNKSKERNKTIELFVCLPFTNIEIITKYIAICQNMAT